MVQKIIYLESYGCSANQNNAEIIAGILEKSGYIIVKNPEIKSDIAIINTCIVKGPTMQRMIFRIKELAKKHAKIIVIGCFVDYADERIKKLVKESNKKCLLSMVSVKQIGNIRKAVNDLLNGKENIFIERKNTEKTNKNRELKLNKPKQNSNKIIGITQISEGCVGNCAYCAVKLAKGDLFSYPRKEILENIEKDLKSGAKEIWITSQDNAIYGLDKGKFELPLLLRDILKLKHRFVIRLGMMNPSSLKEILPEMIEIYKDKKMLKFIHIPVQSGSDNVLREMNRPYKVRGFVDIIDKFRKEVPDILISTDIIIGYPTETQGDFQKTLDLIRLIQPNVVNLSRFWPMPKTKAAELDQLDPDILFGRSIILKELCNKIALEKNINYLGKEIEILIDEKNKRGNLIGRNDNYKQILLPLNEKRVKIGDKIKVKIVGVSIGELKGKVID
ncbi:tRNA (N(6)-L-threonylcarbamoyladenosine(37)-C(2))-methylthiotransferase [Candidatus Pacearchaeota archaeon]|nr:tRNA (N(6)-L-threonylcarbamoyladenosine(37)-C(2))-methylthiotransferase [Candidatus Pacearchaeota archaeon]